jgi:hypothetical protein
MPTNIILPPVSGGGGATLTNSIIPKNRQLNLNPYRNSAVSKTTGKKLPLNQVYFGNLQQGFQIYQNTDIQEIEYEFLSASATDRALVGLYKYDYTTDVFTLVANWTIPALVASPTSVSLASPVTLSAGTYYFGMVGFDQTADAFVTTISNFRALSKIQGLSLGLLNSTPSRVEYNLSTPSTLPTSISGSSINYVYSGDVFIMPTPKFL